MPAVATPFPENPLTAAISLGPTIAAKAEETEKQRRISPELLALLRDAGLFRMVLQREVGGTSTDLPTVLATYEEIARHDGSTGWVTMIGSGNNYILSALPQQVVEAMFSPNPNIATGGFMAPRGRAVKVEGGYRVTGRWPFGSGCEHCDWLLGGCIVYDGDTPVMEDERPLVRMMVFPKSNVKIHDTWNVAGLRGTGSHDYEVSDVFVPHDYSFLLGVDLPAFSSPHARVPLWGLLGVCLASVILGIARGALDAFGHYARTRKIGQELVMDQPLVQLRYAEAEGLVRSARSFVFDKVERVWDSAVKEQDIGPEWDTLMRLSASHAARACTDAVHLVFTAGGTEALYHESPLQRFQRDILTAQQHGMVAFYSLAGIGKTLLSDKVDDR